MTFNIPKIIKRKKRLGRGVANKGSKSGRGMKGQKARAGYSSKAGFEGGQTPLYMRLPKGRGSKQKFPSQQIKPVAITTKQLEYFEEGAIVGPGVLRKAEFIEKKSETIKLIGSDPVGKKLTVRVHAATARAKEAVESAGGKLELIKGTGK